MATEEGQVFAGYRIVKKLGEGGMGAVYKARDLNLDRLIALKMLASDLSHDPEFITRFRREASLAARLDHPHLVRVYSAGEFEGTHYLTMELVEGESARDRLYREGRLQPVEALAIGISVAEALDYGWRHASLIHRDIKPSNIFLSNTGHVKLGDLGLAKSGGDATHGLTTTGQTVGTPSYISPEQGLGQKTIDFRADIYSLGCTLYHLITGELPYAADDSVVVVHKHIYDPLPGILLKIPDCPMPLVFLLGKMMSKQPRARHQSYADLITDMRRVREHILKPSGSSSSAGMDSASVTSPVAGRHSHVFTSIFIAAALAVVGAGLWIWQPWEQPPGAAHSPARPQSGAAADIRIGQIAILGVEGPASAATVKEMEIPARKERGVSLGRVKAGDVLRLQYVSGKWKAWGNLATACPDDPADRGGDSKGGLRNRLSIVNAPAGGTVELLRVVSPGTAAKPFEFVVPRNLENVALRIYDGDGDWASNPDEHVKYRVEIRASAKRE